MKNTYHNIHTQKFYSAYHSRGFRFISNISDDYGFIYARAIKIYRTHVKDFDAVMLEDAYDDLGRVLNGSVALLVNNSVNDLSDFWSIVNEQFKFAYFDQYDKIKRIYQKHVDKLNIMKENLSQHDESWTDADMQKAISEINILSSVLGDINKVCDYEL